MKILTTLSRPTAGRAIVAGYDVVRQPERVRRVIGVVAQKSAVDLEATAGENLTLQGQLYGMTGAELRGASQRCWSGSTSRTRASASRARSPAACSASSTSRWA